MPKSISSIQKKNLSFLETTGSDEFEAIDGLNNVFEGFAVRFMENMAKYAKARGVIASGKLLTDAKYRFSPDGSLLQILMPDYFDYPNEGVKGVKSSKNAPNSPYQYKNYGMSDAGRRSIKKYIRDGHAKIRTVRNDKALGVGLEKKRKSVADAQADTLIYWIKRQGIKATHYFTDAFNDTFKNFEVDMAEALGRDIVVSLKKLDLGNNN